MLWRRAGISAGISGLLLAATAAVSGSGSASSADPARVGDVAASIEHDYVGVGKCKTCHGKELMGDQVAVWRRGLHRPGLETLASPDALRVGSEQGLTGPPGEAPECLVCHVTAYGVPESRISRPLEPDDGVQCESCHGPGRSYRKKKVMSDPDRAHAKGLWEPAKDHGICLRCHNSRSPTFDPKRFRLKSGETTDFDYEQAAAQIAHPIPEDVKGRYLELDEARKAAEKEASDF